MECMEPLQAYNMDSCSSTWAEESLDEKMLRLQAMLQDQQMQEVAQPQEPNEEQSQEPAASLESTNQFQEQEQHEEHQEQPDLEEPAEEHAGPAGEKGCTTVMLRNIPNKYSRDMLVSQLNELFRGRFDFVYLPIDFKNKCNVGYAFVNFRTTESCGEFIHKFDGVNVRKCLPGLNSNKVACVTPARVQGLEENVQRLRHGPVMDALLKNAAWMPLILDEDGHELPFPTGGGHAGHVA
jgi:hypothetical protein